MYQGFFTCIEESIVAAILSFYAQPCADEICQNSESTYQNIFVL